MPGPRPEYPVMNWTVMPAKVIGLAWTDPDFRARLLQDGRDALADVLNNTADLPAQVRVVENSPARTYLPLPVRPQEIADDDELADQIVTEVSDLNSEWALPAQVIAQALTNDAYREVLLRDPASLDLPASIRVLENTSNLHWLALPTRPAIVTLSAEDATRRLTELFGGETIASTTTCCAGGTRT